MTHRRLAPALLLATACAAVRPAPEPPDPYELVLPDVAGNLVSLGSYRGEVLLVTFFATWCFPCLGELPLVQELAHRRGPEGLQVVGIGLDREGALVLAPFKKFYGIEFPVLVGAERFGRPGLPFAPIQILPTTVLIGRDGQLLARWNGLLPRHLLDAIVERALAK
ncbi:MAG: TlpA family protein disulfide reductase [Deltaproteobacteria bacterium]